MSELDRKYSELESFSLASELAKSCRDHAGLAIMISYALITLTGLLYLQTFYSIKFDIAILAFVTIEDVLLAGVREPLIVGVFFAVVVFQLISDMAIRWQAKTMKGMLTKESDTIGQRVIKSLLWVPKKGISIIFGYFVFLIVFNLLIYKFALHKADEILRGESSNEVEITLDGSEKQTFILLGAVNQYVAVYDQGSKKAILYNHEAIIEIQNRAKSRDMPLEKIPETETKAPKKPKREGEND
ncbi:hypothetical protein QGN29_05665 [Temperatibacter marinus]|uniref:Uncharacterized protein n=1 Tax=Temperatibacter marinus TaxID=1456591 RepID=A0AA52EIN8_9PROT|nr:hypothetical protein [Temperatibacter marinus]WND03858.1 hypothetical protein QGN29_05665 [Temperatibacter marinus]